MIIKRKIIKMIKKNHNLNRIKQVIIKKVKNTKEMNKLKITDLENLKMKLNKEVIIIGMIEVVRKIIVHRKKIEVVIIQIEI
jgi:hypothetical protein